MPVVLLLARALPRLGFGSLLAASSSSRSRTYMSTKRKMVKIGTHDGSFHCDEALGCFLLQRTATFKDAAVVRSRNPDVLKELDVVIDVGGEYDAAANRFDHHQRGFTDVFGHGFTTKLSSAGLVYKHFGREIVSGVLGMPESDPRLEVLYLKVYKNFMEAIDGIDNGVNQYDTDAPPKYVSNTNLSSRVAGLNPSWMEESTPELQMTQFEKAMALAGAEFLDCVNYYGKSWLPARDYVVEAINKREEVHPSGEVIQLPRYCPWKAHLYDLEEELKVPVPIKYCLYEDEKGNWRIQCVSLTPSSFENRRGLPVKWRGLRDAELSKESGIEGGIFVHMGGFIGGNLTEKGARAMAARALEIE